MNHLHKVIPVYAIVQAPRNMVKEPLNSLCITAVSKLNDLHDRLSKLKHLMTVAVEKVSKGRKAVTWVGGPVPPVVFVNKPCRSSTAACAARMAIVEGVIGLYDDIPGELPSEAASYRAIKTDLEETMPARLV